MPVLPREAALHTTQTLLRPLASFLLKCGITWREFSEMAKTAFVAAATDHYGIQGRPTNVSRVALLTGLARKEVKRQRDLLQQVQPPAPPEKTTDATRVLSGWHQDGDFLQQDNTPRDLDADDFADLCRRYCSDVPASALLKELLRVGAVEELANGHFKVVTRYYMPAHADVEWMMTAGTYIADLANTIHYNFDLDAGLPTRFLGRASEACIDRDSLDEYHRFLDVAGQTFLESIDAWLAEHQCSKSDQQSGRGVRLGVGVFHIQNGSHGVPNNGQE